jgi:hypothetical protein
MLSATKDQVRVKAVTLDSPEPCVMITGRREERMRIVDRAKPRGTAGGRNELQTPRA